MLLQNRKFVLLQFVLFLFLSGHFPPPTIYAQGHYGQTRVIDWENVLSFAINSSEDYIVFSMKVGEREQLFETSLTNESWSEAQPIDVINNHAGGSAHVGGPSFNYRGNVMYFHANYDGGEGGFDIYHSKKTSNGWSKPVSMGAIINSEDDEFYPHISPGEMKFYFSRLNPDEDVRKPRNAPDCQIIYVSHKNAAFEWETPLPVHDVINFHCEHGLSVSIDGKTVYYASIDPDNHRDGFNLHVAREIHRGAWVLPKQIFQVFSADDNIINPRVVGDKLYFIRQYERRRETMGSIYKVRLLADDYLSLPTIVSKGAILNLENDEPIPVSLTVFDPTTLAVIGIYENDSGDGSYEIPLPDHQNYIVDVRNPLFSFASFQVDFRTEEKVPGPEMIKLFDEIDLVLSVYDGEIFRPLDAEVWATMLTDGNKRIDAEELAQGTYLLELPIGHNYRIHADATGFVTDGFNFDLFDDIIFSRFERNIPLNPVTLEIDFYIVDKDTQEPVNAEIILDNIDREETITIPYETIEGGHAKTFLRESDSYDMTARGAVGYSFHNEIIKVSALESGQVSIELTALHREIAIQLNNIHFATNSAELTSESFAELERVIDLIFTNPNVIIEISAHTDDVGTDAYNMRLSHRRAQSVVSYLVGNGVPPERLTSMGYGLRRPLVPNTSDENRALNRRVEFTIIDITEE